MLGQILSLSYVSSMVSFCRSYLTSDHSLKFDLLKRRNILGMNPKNIYEKYSGGPHGLGDPDDLFLRKVELDVMIPKKLRDLTKTEKCFKEVEEFTECGKNAGLLMVVKCRGENTKLKACLTKWYEDEDFKERCKQEYLKERSEYRRTGLTMKQKQQRIGM